MRHNREIKTRDDALNLAIDILKDGSELPLYMRYSPEHLGAIVGDGGTVFFSDPGIPSDFIQSMRKSWMAVAEKCKQGIEPKHNGPRPTESCGNAVDTVRSPTYRLIDAKPIDKTAWNVTQTSKQSGATE